MRSLQTLSAVALVTSALSLWGCTSADPQPGQLGGPCRASLTPCDPGLICNGNGCQQTGGGEPSGEIGVTFSFRDGKTGVEADGKDTTILVARFTRLNNGVPQPAPDNLQFRMWVDPPEAGTLEFDSNANPEVQGQGRVPYRITDANGAATARFTGCNKESEGCVAFANIRVAVAPDVLVPLDSVAVENIGAVVVPVDPGDPEDPEEPVAIPTPPLPDGFGPRERCAGQNNVLYLKGTETAKVYNQDGMVFSIDTWQNTSALPPQNADFLNLELQSEAVGNEVTFFINSRPTDAWLVPQEYADVTSVSAAVDGQIRFEFAIRNGPLGEQCSRDMDRRFAIQQLVIEGGVLKRLALSFVQGCDGGIIEGCLNLEAVEAPEE